MEDFVELAQFEIDGASARLLPRAFAEAHRLVILGRVEAGSAAPVRVGMLDPNDKARVLEVEQALGRRVEAVQLSDHEISRAIARAWDGGARRAEGALELVPVDTIRFSGELEIPRTLSEILARAVTLGASDVHLEAHQDDVDVRFRIDGALRQISHPLGPREHKMAMARLKVLAGLDIAETRAVQEGRVLATFVTPEGRRPVDFRLSVVPGPFGEDAVLRVLEAKRALTALPALGFHSEQLPLVEELLASPEGLILVTGPTGSGKTTTLYSMLASLARPELKVMTVEDPIEYRLPKVNQKQVGFKLGFADYTRAFLRQDPDVMMVGEIRDGDTAEVAVRAAQTGHLVLTTLHTNDSVSAVRRLETLGVVPENLSETLLAVIAQRLVRRVCEACRELRPVESSAALPAGLRVSRSFAGRGCGACGGDGLAGRTALFELFVPDEELADLIASAAPIDRVRRRAREKGMRLLVEDGLRKVEEGVTTIEELRAALSYRVIHEYAPL